MIKSIRVAQLYFSIVFTCKQDNLPYLRMIEKAFGMQAQLQRFFHKLKSIQTDTNSPQETSNDKKIKIKKGWNQSDHMYFWSPITK